MTDQMTLEQARQYAYARDIIAKPNAAGTRLWFYTGDHDRKSTWLALGAATINDNGTVDQSVIEMICR